MVTFNRVILAGNLVRDPETRFLPSGVAVTSFSIAVNRRYKSTSAQSRSRSVRPRRYSRRLRARRRPPHSSPSRFLEPVLIDLLHYRENMIKGSSAEINGGILWICFDGDCCRTGVL